MKPIHNSIICKDGTKLSIQASMFHYCSPRNDTGPYLKVEVGFITDKNGEPVTPPKTWKEYADGEFPNDVYGYVPTDMVEKFIKSHGGISIGESI